MTKELIGKPRELSDRVFHGDTKPGDFRIIDRAADTLAARQPRESDRESLAQLIALGLDDTKNLGDWSQDYQDEMYQAADVILAAGFSRTAVPDAVTEASGSNKTLSDEYLELLHDVQTKYVKDTDALFLARKRAEAERDAALAAIERVRALVTEWKHEGPSGPFPDRIAIDVGVEVIEPLLAALDGAPEPEWEYNVGAKSAEARGLVRGGGYDSWNDYEVHPFSDEAFSEGM